MKYEISSWQRKDDGDHEDLVDDIKSSPHQYITFKKGDGTLKQQWLSLLVGQHPILCAWRVPTI